MAEIFQKIQGLIASYLQLGISGPRIKDSSGVIEARNTGDTAYSIVRAASPVGNHDLVTKGSLSTSVQVMEYAFPSGVEQKKPSYAILCTMVFRGTSEVGSPASIFIIGGKDPGSSGTVQYRLYDLTNSLVIAESSVQSVDFPTLIDLGTVSNLPASQAMWEMQAKKVSGSANAILGAISIRW